MSVSSVTLLEIQNARESEESPLAMEQVFAALGSVGGHQNIFQRLFGGGHAQPSHFSLEIVSVNSRIHFFLAAPDALREYLESQLTAQYPRLLITKTSDYMEHFFTLPHAVGQLVYGNSFYLPLKTYKEIKN